MSIRPPSEEDAGAFLAAMRASRALHRPWVSMPDTPAAYAAYLERSRRADSPDGASTSAASTSMSL